MRKVRFRPAKHWGITGILCMPVLLIISLYFTFDSAIQNDLEKTLSFLFANIFICLMFYYYPMMMERHDQEDLARRTKEENIRLEAWQREFEERKRALNELQDEFERTVNQRINNDTYN